MTQLTWNTVKDKPMVTQIACDAYLWKVTVYNVAVYDFEYF